VGFSIWDWLLIPPTEFAAWDDERLLVGSVKAIVGLRPSFSAHVRLGERGAPVLFPKEEIRGLDG
jgi:hypothetical protein